MKILLFLVFISNSVYSQSKSLDSLKRNKESVSFYNYYQTNKTNTLFKPTTIKVKPLLQSRFFTVYNNTSKLNDNYLIYDDSLFYTNSQKILENDFRGYKIDSYNPHGASSFTSGIALGVLNLLLNEL